MRTTFILLSFFISTFVPLSAQVNVSSISDTSLRDQSCRIDDLLDAYKESNQGTMQGYRVQMYYGNNQLQSKHEADKIKSEYLNEFPNKVAYLEYDAPFWRLFVGDFRTYRDAKKESLIIASSFPQYGGNLIIIPKTINLPVIPKP